MCIDVAVLTVLRSAVIYKYIPELSVLGASVTYKDIAVLSVMGKLPCLWM